MAKNSAIAATFYIDKKKHVIGFCIKDHGKSIVCAGVSALALNAVNSIDALTATKYDLNYEPTGGFLSFKLKTKSEDAILLLNSLKLGIDNLKKEYPTDISIIEEEVLIC